MVIKSKHKSIEMGYGAFAKIRMQIALMTNKEIAQHYDDLFKEYSDGDFSEYDDTTDYLAMKYPEFVPILDFLYTPDCDGVYSDCEPLWELIKDSEISDNFKEVIKDGAENDGIEWY